MVVILDTNVWLSGIFWGGKPGLIVDRVFRMRSGLIPVFSEETLAELEEKLGKRWYSKIINRLRMISQVIEAPPAGGPQVRDPDDQIWVDLCLASGAHYLVTGDQDLLVMNKIGRTRIIRPSEFVRV